MRQALLLLLFVFYATCQRNFQLTSLSAPKRVLPNASASFRFTVKNTGTTAWAANAVNATIYRVTYDGHQSLFQRIPIGSQTPANGEANVTGQITFARPGLWRFETSLQDAQGVFGSSFTFEIDQTCSDGIFCNGVEQLVNGTCVRGDPPCLSAACYNATCDESSGRCHYVVHAGCPTCDGQVCVANCTGKVCGPDGCEGTCGDCSAGTGCVEGACMPSVGDGSCSSPLPLVPGGIAAPGSYLITGDTSSRVNEIIPTCNALSDAKDMIYKFTVPTGMRLGLEARVVGTGTFTDTVLELRGNCSDPSTAIACSDDSTPPGGLFSRVKAMLNPGNYFLYVDGFSSAEEGPFELSVKFVNDCIPQCDGSFCGSDLCGGICGTCDNSSICYETSYGSFRCKPDPCIADCTNKSCGDDGCDGSCGSCPQNQLCIYESGICQAFSTCDHLAPECTGCSGTQYCGSDCQCHELNSARPDFVVDGAGLTTDLLIEFNYFPTSACAWFERCVGGPGWRRLLKFSSVALNQGFAGFEPPEPKTRPDLFQYSPCHNHYHFQGFANYELIDFNNTVVGFGHKQGYCMEDSAPGITRPDVPCTSAHDCGNQGISPGWADAYGSSLDCQWIDITDISPGVYILRVTVNPDRIIDELSYENNVGETIVTIPDVVSTMPTSAAMTSAMNSAMTSAMTSAVANSTMPIGTSIPENSSAVSICICAALSLLFLIF